MIIVLTPPTANAVVRTSRLHSSLPSVPAARPPAAGPALRPLPARHPHPPVPPHAPSPPSGPSPRAIPTLRPSPPAGSAPPAPPAPACRPAPCTASPALGALLARAHATAVAPPVTGFAPPVTGGATVLPACTPSSPSRALLRVSDNAFECLLVNKDVESCPGGLPQLGRRWPAVEPIAYSAARRGLGKTCAGLKSDATCEGKCVDTASGQGMWVGCAKVELPAYDNSFSGKLGCGASLLDGDLREEDEDVETEVEAETDVVLTNASDDEVAGEKLTGWGRSPNNLSSGRLSIGPIIGDVVGSLLVLLACCCGVLRFRKRNMSSKSAGLPTGLPMTHNMAIKDAKAEDVDIMDVGESSNLDCATADSPLPLSVAAITAPPPQQQNQFVFDDESDSAGDPGLIEPKRPVHFSRTSLELR